MIAGSALRGHVADVRRAAQALHGHHRVGQSVEPPGTGRTFIRAGHGREGQWLARSRAPKGRASSPGYGADVHAAAQRIAVNDMTASRVEPRAAASGRESAPVARRALKCLRRRAPRVHLGGDVAEVGLDLEWRWGVRARTGI